MRGTPYHRCQGVYRISGAKSHIEQMKEFFDKDADAVTLSLGLLTVHDACSLLKQYFRELPEPVIPVKRYVPFLQVPDTTLTRNIDPRAAGGPAQGTRRAAAATQSARALAAGNQLQHPQGGWLCCQCGADVRPADALRTPVQGVAVHRAEPHDCREDGADLCADADGRVAGVLHACTCTSISISTSTSTHAQQGHQQEFTLQPHEFTVICSLITFHEWVFSSDFIVDKRQLFRPSGLHPFIKLPAITFAGQRKAGCFATYFWRTRTRNARSACCRAPRARMFGRPA